MMSYPGRISVGVLVIVIMVLGSTFLMVSGNGSAVRLQCMRRCVFSLFHCMIFNFVSFFLGTCNKNSLGATYSYCSF
jgi:hypothetical protein